MPYTPAPLKDEISATPSPSNAVAKAGMGKFWEMVTGLLGSTGNPEDAHAAMKLNDPKALRNLAPTFAVDAITHVMTITIKDAAGNDLGAANPGYVAQRNVPIGSSGFGLKKIAANIAQTLSSGSTLGHTSGKLHPIYIHLIDNAGVAKIGLAGSFQGESGICTTVAEGGAGDADDPNVMYSDGVYADKAFRLIAIAWSNQVVAGQWDAVPLEVKSAPFHLAVVGEIVDYGGGVVPYGYFLQDGSNYSRATYAKLYGKIGTAHGVGDGATTFGIGDSRRRVLVGSGGAGTAVLGNAVGNTGGEEAHAQTSAEVGSHVHVETVATNPTTIQGDWPKGVADSTGSPNGSAGLETNPGGGGAPFNVMQPSLVVTKMIRWLGDI